MKLNRILCVLFVLYGVSPLALASKRDSLAILVSTQGDNREKIDNLVELSDAYTRVDLDTSMIYAQQALDLSEQLKYTKGKGKVIGMFAIIHFYRGNNEPALQYGKEALEFAESINDKHTILKVSNALSAIYSAMDRKDKSIIYLQQVYNAAEELKDSLYMMFSLNNLATLHKEENNIEESSKYYKEISTFKVHDKRSLIFKTYYYFGSGSYYSGIKDYNQAIKYFLKGIPIAEKDNNLFGLAALHNALGVAYKQINQIEAAEYNFSKAIKVFTKIGAKEAYLSAYIELSDLYNEKGDYAEAVNSGTLGLMTAREMNNLPGLAKLSLVLAKAYESLGQIPLALQYQKEHKTWSDSLAILAKDEIVLRMESEYQVNLLEEQQVTNAAVIKQEKQKNYTFLLLLLLATISTLFFWNNFRSKEVYSKDLEKKVEERTKELKLSNEELTVANSELERFAFVSAHDLKEHIRNIGSYSGLLKKSSLTHGQKDEKSKSYFSVLESSTEAMSQMVDDILKYVSIEDDSSKEIVNLNSILKEVEAELAIDTENVSGGIVAENLPSVWANRKQIYFLFREVIENGFKFNKSDKPKVEISHRKKNGIHHIDIADNGIGISQEYAEQVFTMFTRLNGRSDYKGTGLGLSLVKKIINNMGGAVSISEGKNGGSKVHLKLPSSEKTK